jgi:hypothetical protein
MGDFREEIPEAFLDAPADYAARPVPDSPEFPQIPPGYIPTNFTKPPLTRIYARATMEPSGSGVEIIRKRYSSKDLMKILRRDG